MHYIYNVKRCVLVYVYVIWSYFTCTSHNYSQVSLSLIIMFGSVVLSQIASLCANRITMPRNYF